MGVLSVSPSLPRQGWVTGCVSEQMEFRENPAHDAAFRNSHRHDEMGEGGEQLYTKNFPCCWIGTLWNDSALVSLGRLRPLALLRWDSQDC